MLTDEEIDRLTRAYVRKHYGPVLPGIEPLWENQLVRHFDLEDPPGVYFTVRILPKAPRKSVSNDFLEARFGDAGFFVDGRTGAIGHFDSGEFLNASDVVAGVAYFGLSGGTIDGQQVVHYLLTHSSEELQSDIEALRQQRPGKKRWQFWKR